jgi:uncharacterized protein
MRQMRVDNIGNTPSHDPVVILKDLDGKYFLPIIIGPFEATAIAIVLDGSSVPRPLSHDLMRALLEVQHAKLEQVVIHDLKEATFFAKLMLRINDEVHEVDARPSDGIALALRMKAPIYIDDSKIALEPVPAEKQASPADMERFRQFINELKPSDFTD